MIIIIVIKITGNIYIKTMIICHQTTIVIKTIITRIMTIQIIRQNFRLTGTLPSSVSSTCGNIGNTTDISNDNDKQN